MSILLMMRFPLLKCQRILVLCAAILVCASLAAQTPDEHAQHHPAAGMEKPSPAANPSGGMEPMMGMMGGQPPRQLYPALMTLPDLPPEQRADIERMAHLRMSSGARAMTEAVDAVAGAIEQQNFDAMQKAVLRVGTALNEFESGLAAHRALAEGQAPRSIALRWFKREMSLADPLSEPQPHGVFGLSSFHYASMFLLAVAALLGSWMYVARSRRVRALLASLHVDTLPRDAARVAIPPATAGAQPVIEGITPVSPSATGNWAGNLRIARIFQETPSVKTFRLAPSEGPGPLPFLFEPGQFLTIGVPVDGKLSKRSYSIASSPCCHGWCEITVKHEQGGAVSTYLHEQSKEGDRLDASGPYGRFTFRGHEAPSVVFIAGGVGITPLMSSIRYLTDQSWNGRIDLIYACASLDAIIFREELALLARRHPNLHVAIVLSKEPSAEWTGARGHVDSKLLAGVPDIRSRRIHMCGPPVMMDAVNKALGDIGVMHDSIHTETFLNPKSSQPPALATTPGAAAITCSFTRSDKRAPLVEGQTVLECAESIHVPIEYACRQGFCGVCKVKLVAGDVEMAVQDALTPADKSAGLILACQAKAVVDITVDA